MSEHIYEARQLALWAEYTELNGFVSFEAFMERHVNENAWIVRILRESGGPLSFDVARPKVC